jgi:aspartate carbamoyltransferase catalytic subunit
LPARYIACSPAPEFPFLRKKSGGTEITSDAADSPQSIILDQVENGVAVRMAVLYLVAAGL